MYIDPLITTLFTAMDLATDIELAVHNLKTDRDTWQAVALKYKEASEALASHVRQLQDICFATQAELENERAQQRLTHSASDQSEKNVTENNNSNEDMPSELSFGTAAIYALRKHRKSDEYMNPLFEGVRQCTQQQDYKTAIIEVERLLRGPLSAKARVEGLLLKSEVLRQTGPNELYDALAACSEALELSDRLLGLEVFLPRIHYQRGVIFYDLRTNCLAIDHHVPRLETCHYSTRRSGFDEQRTIDEEILAKIEVLGMEVREAFATFL